MNRVTLATFLFIIALSESYNPWDYHDSKDGIEFEYAGFQGCQYGPWKCQKENDSWKITHSCFSYEKNIRIWIWTARFPEKTAVFTVENCGTVEIHVDCTEGSRTSSLRRFEVINVTYAKFLQPTFPGKFLHDNVDSAILPPEIHLENVRKVQMLPQLFKEPKSQCQLHSAPLQNFTFINVTIDKLFLNILQNFTLDKMLLQNIRVNTIGPNAFSVNAAQILILDSIFPNLPDKAVTLFAKEKIVLRNNTFRVIQNGALNFRTKFLQFSENYVEELGTQSMDILALKINIKNNFFNHIDFRALENVALAFTANTFALAAKFTYNFTGNSIRYLAPGSLHPNWVAFKDACVSIDFSKNAFDCSCMNFGWVTVFHGLGPKIAKVKDFYEKYLLGEDQYCMQNRSCPYKKILSRMPDVCSNRTTITEICRGNNNSYKDSTTLKAGVETTPITKQSSVIQREQQPRPSTTEWYTTTAKEKLEQTKKTPLEKDYDSVEAKVLPPSYYAENQPLNKEKGNANAWFAVIPVVLIFAITSLGLFLWWNKRGTRRHDVTTVYKNHGENDDDDNPIVINEHCNQLYNDKN